MSKDFLDINDFSAQELQQLLDLAKRLKVHLQAGGNAPLLKGKVLAMIFQKPSLRTRVSFDMAMRQMGGDALYLSPAEIGLGQREAISDVARVLSGYVSAIMARVFAHEHVLELARWATIPVINGLSDYSHPCQALADALTLDEHFGGLKHLNVTFIGDANNVARSLMQISTKLGANFSIASPGGYQFDAETIRQAEQLAHESGAHVTFVEDPWAAVHDADVIYTDTWVSMGSENEAEARQRAFTAYQVNAQLLAAAKPGCVVMHCLPAHRGQEITDDVMDGPQSLIFQQAENRLHAQKAILVNLFEEVIL
jgi:ornithine carbamoyltransferase